MRRPSARSRGKPYLATVSGQFYDQNGPTMRAAMRSVAKRSVRVGRHKTSISIEGEFWSVLKEIAASRQTTCYSLLSEINERRQSANLSSAIRLFVLQHYQERVHQLEHAASSSS